MTEVLTTAQVIFLLGIIAVAAVFWIISLVATFNNDIQKTLRYVEAAMLVFLLAVAFFVLSIAKNTNFDPWSLVQ